MSEQKGSYTFDNKPSSKLKNELKSPLGGLYKTITLILEAQILKHAHSRMPSTQNSSTSQTLKVTWLELFLKIATPPFFIVRREK